jgi:microcystin-dependent protein
MSRLAQLAAILPGTMLPTANPSPAGPGWLLCNGAIVSRTTYAALFAVIGTAFNTGGEAGTDFRLPDMRGRTIIGVGTGSGLTARALAATGGEEAHVTTEAEMPLHGHPFRAHYLNDGTPEYDSTGGFTTCNDNDASYAAHTGAPSETAGQQIGGAGGGAAHNNMQPFLALNWVIKY